MNVRGLLLTLVGLWVVFAGISYTFDPVHVFHFLNGLAIAAGLITIHAYLPGVIDMWEHRYNRITAGHLLTLGVCTNWIGFTIRLGRWYVVDATPANDFPQWAYNVGLWVSICAAIMLTGVVALSEPRWSWRRIAVYAVAFVAISSALFYQSHF